MELNELSRLLHERQASCVIENRGVVRIFTRRGVADLYDLLQDEPVFLHGASLADKVIGKGAAALMVLGGVKRVHTDVISRPALQLLQDAHIEVECGQVVPHIINRAGDGWCPLETASRNLHTAEDILPVIHQFIAQQRKGA